MPSSMHSCPKSHSPANNHGTKCSARNHTVGGCWTFCHQFYSFDEFILLVHISSGFPGIPVWINLSVSISVCSVDRGSVLFVCILRYLKWIIVHLKWIIVDQVFKSVLVSSGVKHFCFTFFFTLCIFLIWLWICFPFLVYRYPEVLYCF